MGDPRRSKKKFAPPAHMWLGTRIADEAKLKNEFGLKNNHEIWHANLYVSEARKQAGYLIGKEEEKHKKQMKLLIGRLTRLGLIAKGSTLSDILAIKPRDVLGRRLQTLIKDKGIAKTPREARQMITHGQVKFSGRVHTKPSTLVPVDRESTIGYVGPSRTIRPPRKKESQGATESPALDSAVKQEAKPQ